jgi:hypothetical protein
MRLLIVIGAISVLSACQSKPPEVSEARRLYEVHMSYYRPVEQKAAMLAGTHVPWSSRFGWVSFVVNSRLLRSGI